MGLPPGLRSPKPPSSPKLASSPEPASSPAPERCPQRLGAVPKAGAGSSSRQRGCERGAWRSLAPSLAPGMTPAPAWPPRHSTARLGTARPASAHPPASPPPGLVPAPVRARHRGRRGHGGSASPRCGAAWAAARYGACCARRVNHASPAPTGGRGHGGGGCTGWAGGARWCARGGTRAARVFMHGAQAGSVSMHARRSSRRIWHAAV